MRTDIPRCIRSFIFYQMTWAYPIRFRLLLLFAKGAPHILKARGDMTRWALLVGHLLCLKKLLMSIWPAIGRRYSLYLQYSRSYDHIRSICLQYFRLIPTFYRAIFSAVLKEKTMNIGTVSFCVKKKATCYLIEKLEIKSQKCYMYAPFT